MAYLYVIWFSYFIAIGTTNALFSMIGRVYDQTSYNSTGPQLADLVLKNKLLCAVQCADRFLTCNIAVFDSSDIPQCRLFSEIPLLSRFVVSTTAVVYDFQQSKSGVSTSTGYTTITTTVTPPTLCTAIFPSATSYSTGGGSRPLFLSVVDVNNDSRPDIIFANEIQFRVGVLINLGSGVFLPATTYSTGVMSYPQCVSVVDVNGDHRPDIIVANNGGNNFGVLFNFGNGTFRPQITYSTGGSSFPPSVTAADVNNDSTPDIIVANQNVGTVGVFFNLGNGTFLPQTTYSTGSNAGPTSVVVADVNSDGKSDIIMANYNAGNVGVLLNFGNGTFLPIRTYSTGNNSNPRSVSVVDIDGDNKLDLIVANQNLGNIGVFVNLGNGTFLPQITYPTGNNTSPISVVARDVDSDGKPDIIVANYNANSIGILLNFGDGTFLPITTCLTGTNSRPQSISVVDVNNDTKVDIIVANSGGSNIGVLIAN